MDLRQGNRSFAGAQDDREMPDRVGHDDNQAGNDGGIEMPDQVGHDRFFASLRMTIRDDGRVVVALKRPKYKTKAYILSQEL